MGISERQAFLTAIRARYWRTRKKVKVTILDEFCAVCGYNRRLAGKQKAQWKRYAEDPRQLLPALPYYTPSLALIGAWADAAGFRRPAKRRCRPFCAPRRSKPGAYRSPCLRNWSKIVAMNVRDRRTYTKHKRNPDA